jgi:hypothetical protein
LLRLYEIEQEWQRAGLRIGAGWGEEGASLRPSLYRRVLGRDFEQLAVERQALHDACTSTWDGRCRVDGAASLPARLVSWLFQLSPATPDAQIIVEFTVRDGQEVRTRHDGRRSMRSRQSIGTRKPRGSIVECFGPFAFDLALRIAEGRLWLVPTGARFTFDVEIGLPVDRPPPEQAIAIPRDEVVDRIAQDHRKPQQRLQPPRPSCQVTAGA